MELQAVIEGLKALKRRTTVRLDTGLAPHITVALRMDEANEAPLDYYRNNFV